MGLFSGPPDIPKQKDPNKEAEAKTEAERQTRLTRARRGISSTIATSGSGLRRTLG